ncbi:hypothetical protein SADO_11544 [Salinisphaera dokdonensis CL-ES53]|uniref:OmpA-like domain-containing protein n=1 Tax=Salinisphaera dokdonensis CL-ES53 TaxID=1304272 RepID=A0ABV2B1W2_9GAMM
MKRVLVVLCVLAALIAAALLWLPSVAARQLTLHYLNDAGVSATIGDVDVDLFSGTVDLRNAKGRGPEGDGFSIDQLTFSVDYAPLLSKRLSLSTLAVENAALDIRRGTDNSLRIGGIPITSAESGDSQPIEWGLALREVAVRGLRIHYMQPANGEQPAIDHEVVLNDSSARDVVTWQADNDVPLDANLRVGDSRIQLKGRITPFGESVSGHFELQTEDFALDLLSPLTQARGLQRLTGTVDSEQQIDIDYAPSASLTIGIDGSADWQASALAMANGLALSGDRLSWRGQIQLDLLRPAGQPATVESEGRLQVAGLALEQPEAFSLKQATGDWQGRTTTTLAADATRITTDGKLDAGDVEITAGATNRFSAPALSWQGSTQADIAPDASAHVQSKGRFSSERLDMALAGDTRIETRGLGWQGNIETTTGKTVQVDSDGTLDAQRLDISLAGSSTVSGRGLNWRGRVQADADKDVEIDSDGKLKAERLDTTLAGDTRINGRQLDWNGTLKTVAGADIRVDSDGALKASQMNLQVPGSVELGITTMDWQGAFDVAAGSSTRISSDGRLDTRALRFAVPETATFQASAALWNGAMDFDIANQVSRRTRGRLIANTARLALPGQPIALAADRLVFNGDYSEQPVTSGELKLNMAGDITAQAFKLDNTAIGAPWVALRDAELDNLAIDGVDDIGFDTLNATGVRVLGDTDTSAAVLDATTASARGFQLRALRDYRLSTLAIDGADIHIRHDADGMGVMALYFGGDGDTPADSSRDASNSAASTYALDHLTLSGPSIAFTDVAVNPPVSLTGSTLELTADGLDTGNPDRDANFRLALDVGQYGHLDSRGTIAPLATGGMNMDLDAWLRSLALAPMSGYLNAAMGRRIARGVADGTLNLEATDGQLDGNLDTTLSNFRLVETPNSETEIVFGISMDTALGLVRGQDDTIQFETAILGDVTNPYFSVRNLVREAVLAGLRTTIMSDYSPLGLLNKAKNALLNLGRSLVSKPVVFVAGKHYIRPEDRGYLGNIAQSMREKPGLRLTVQGHATPQDADAMSLFGGDTIDSGNEPKLRKLAGQRASAVRDYLAARDVNPEHITLGEPVIDRETDASPEATFSLTGK